MGDVVVKYSDDTDYGEGFPKTTKQVVFRAIFVVALLGGMLATPFLQGCSDQESSGPTLWQVESCSGGVRYRCNVVNVFETRADAAQEAARLTGRIQMHDTRQTEFRVREVEAYR